MPWSARSGLARSQKLGTTTTSNRRSKPWAFRSRAMSRENVELTRAFFEAWNAGDMNAVRESYDPHVVVRYAEGWPEGSEPIMGREAVMRGWEQQREPFDADSLELIETIDLGDRVVARSIWRAVGSGPDLKIEVTSV